MNKNNTSDMANMWVSRSNLELIRQMKEHPKIPDDVILTRLLEEHKRENKQ